MLFLIKRMIIQFSTGWGHHHHIYHHYRHIDHHHHHHPYPVGHGVCAGSSEVPVDYHHCHEDTGGNDDDDGDDDDDCGIKGWGI